MMRRPLLGVALAGALAAGCGRVEDASPAGLKPVEAAFLVAGDVTPGAVLAALSEAKMVAELQDADAVYAHRPAAADGGGGDCFGDLLASVTLRATETTLRYGAEIDFRRCMQEAFASDADAPTVTSATMRFFVQLECEGADLTPYDGKPASEAKAIDVGATCTAGTQLTNVDTTAAVSGHVDTGAGKVPLAFGVRYVTYQGTGAMTPCGGTAAGGVVTVTDGCMDVSRTLYTTFTVDGEDHPLPGEDYVRLVAKGLSHDVEPGAVWHRGGTIEAQVNQWQGKLTYAGPAAPPAYVMALGAQTAAGTLTVAPALTGLPRSVRHSWNGGRSIQHR